MNIYNKLWPLLTIALSINVAHAMDIEDALCSTNIADTKVMEHYRHSAKELAFKKVTGGVCLPQTPHISAVASVLTREAHEHLIHFLLKAAKLHQLYAHSGLCNFKNKNKEHKYEQYQSFLHKSFTDVCSIYPELAYQKFIDRLNEYADLSYVTYDVFSDIQSLLSYLFRKDGKKFYKYIKTHESIL